ncbi:MAG TPA: energy transducer TonB [Candidatus Sulfotelmatobacter sp.]|jgi:TonB family protein|nr:energy transducer TonB [Candidatus Sulfotelmatobacter sp.]
MSRLRRIKLLVATTALSLSVLPFVPAKGLAQDSGATGDVKDHGGRKVKTSVKPAYPDVARRMHITGTVRLEATVTADGHVRDTRVLGGSPMLVEEATNAVKKWKYEEAPKETVETVEVVYQ